MPAPDDVKRLVDHFDQNRKVFLSGDYKEKQLRDEFLNGPCLTIRHSDFGIRTFPGPFFTALGWDMDDKSLKDITCLRATHRQIGNLYYPDSPYEFSVMPADVLGQVYEQFLGKVIRLTAGHQAKVEEKPEVRKAGGVYYTPTYIVDYIVKNTVGKMKRGSERGQQHASPLRSATQNDGGWHLGSLGPAKRP